MYFLGIDGGGTKTAFEIIDERGNILSGLKTATCNYIQIGKENFGKLILDGTAEVCRKAHIVLSDLDYTCIGIPSFGENAADAQDLKNIVEGILRNGKVKCVNDVEVAWSGSLGCEPGINLLAGTGSMGYGMDQKSNALRVGGWGYFCGDEGSAYWLGKKLIELFSKQADGRLKKGGIYDVVRKRFGLKSDFDFISVVYDRLKFKREEIAKLQLLLNEAADKGDNDAVDAYRQSAYELSLIVSTIIDKLDFDKDKSITVSYSGGVFKAGSYILSPLKNYIKNYNVSLCMPLLSPVSGAALNALITYTHKKDTQITANLCSQDGSAAIV